VDGIYREKGGFEMKEEKVAVSPVLAGILDNTNACCSSSALL
jgi:hypothetical protein